MKFVLVFLFYEAGNVYKTMIRTVFLAMISSFPARIYVNFLILPILMGCVRI